MTIRTQTTRIASYGLILQGGEILLCHLSNSNRWTMPGGGIEFGESPEVAMIREVAEETGFEVSADRLLGINSFTIDRDGQDFHSIQIVFESAIQSGELTFEAEGSTDMCAWHPLDEVRELDTVELVQFSIDLLDSRGV